MNNLDDIVYQVETCDFTWCQISDREGNKVALKSGGTKLPPVTKEDVVKFLRDHYERFPGTYNLAFKKRWNIQDASKHLYKSVSGGPRKDNSSGSTPHVPVYSESEIEARIYKRIDEANKAKEKERILAEALSTYKKKSAELDFAAGKLYHIGAKFLELIMSKNPGLLGVLQGTQNTQPMPENIEPVDLASLTAEQKKQCDISLSILLTYMHPDLLYKFAQKVHADPSIVKTLSTFL